MERYEQCRQTVEEGLRQKIDLSREVSDEEVREMIDEMVIHCSRQYALSLKDRQQLGREIFDAIRRMDILQELVEEEEVTEIMINGTQGIFIERKGRLYERISESAQHDDRSSCIFLSGTNRDLRADDNPQSV